jgi:hypothetical protein
VNDGPENKLIGSDDLFDLVEPLCTEKVGDVGSRLADADAESPDAFEVECPALLVSICICRGLKGHPPNPLLAPPSCAADASLVSLSGGGNLYIGSEKFWAVRALIANDWGREVDEEEVKSRVEDVLLLSAFTAIMK